LGFFRLRAGAVFPGVHFLGYNVGFFANAAGEEGCVFKDRGADFAEVVAGEDGAGSGFNAVPEGGFRGQQVTGAADGFQSGHGFFSLNGKNELHARDLIYMAANLRENALSQSRMIPRLAGHFM
jgi:hypothetical protein